MRFKHPTETVGIIGAGRVGQAIGRLVAADFPVLFASRSRAAEAAELAGPGARAVPVDLLAAESRCIVIAVPDRSVPALARRIAKAGPAVVLQCCGALGPSDLRPLPGMGVPCATFHPLQSIPSPGEGVRSLPGSAFGVCGHPRAAGWCERLAGAMGCRTIRVDEDGLARYHAAAVLASNCVVGLLDAATRLMAASGIERDRAARALRPLAETSCRNALTMGAEQALTGPVARGDAATVKRHVESLRDCSPSALELYRALGRYILPLAAERGLSSESALAVERCLDEEP